MKKIISVSIVVIFTVIILLYIQVHNFVPEQTQENETPQDAYSDIVEKDRDSRTENPEVNESIPDSTGEMAGGDDSYAFSEEEKKVLLAYRWLEPGIKDGYNMMNLYEALSRFWSEGEPSHTGLTESGVEVSEDYVVLFYRGKDGRCYLNDVPNDILEAVPSYAGKVGYICEYE